MFKDNHKTLHDLTIDDVDTAAEVNAEQYERMFRKAARAAFIEGVIWAQQTNKPYRSC